MAEKTHTTPLLASQVLSPFLAEARPALARLAAAAHARLLQALVIGNQREVEARAEYAAQLQAARRIQSAYRDWLADALQKENNSQESSIDEGVRQKKEQQQQRAFSQQAGYVFFARVLLARVLGDKAIGPGFASNEDFKCWLQAL